MNFDPIIQHVQQNAAAYAVGGVIALVLTVVFRKFVLPLLYHTTEYLLYFAVAHSMLAGFVRAFSWFREETQFKNYKGDLDPGWTPYSTPFSIYVWKKDLYNPQWLFWIEVALAAFLLYVVIVIRPTRLKHKAHQSKKPKPGQISAGMSYNAKTRTASSKMKSAR